MLFRSVAEALATLAQTPRLTSPVCNVSAQTAWSVLDWGQMMARDFPNGTCRLAQPGETPTIDLYGPADRAPMSATLLTAETGWCARFDMESSVTHLAAWRDMQNQQMKPESSHEA